MNILCNEGGFVVKFVKEGDLGLPRGRLEEDINIAMRVIGPKWESRGLPPNGGALATMYYHLWL